MRRFIAALAFALSFGLLIAACDSGVTGPAETSMSEQDAAATQQGPPGGNPAKLAQQLNTVRQVTKKYRDLETAREDGYVAISPYVPGMGFHLAAPAEAPNPFGTELENPGVLVYYTNGSYNPDPGEFHDPERDDDLILGAVEYLVQCNKEANPPNIFDDEDSPRNLKVTEEEGWHFEDEELLGVGLDCEEDVGFTGLHAWVHRGNPAGVFHDTNPNIE